MKYIETIENKEGIIIAVYKCGLTIKLEEAKEMVKERLNFQDGKTYPVIIHLNGLLKVTSKAARKYMANEGIKGISIGAIIMTTYIEKTIFNFFLSWDKPNVPTSIFTCESDAIQWIKNYQLSNN